MAPLRALALALASLALGLALGLVLARHRYGDLGEAFYQLLPYLPSEWFQAVGVWYVWADTCVVLPTARRLGLMKPALPCRGPGEETDLWVVVATNKGGSILGARASIDIAEMCGLCYGFGYRHHGRWDPPDQEELPTYPSEIFPAIPNVHTWPKYAFAPSGKPRKVRCVVISRDPFSRFQSLFQYSIDAGEYGLREASVVLNNMTRGAAAGPDVQANMDRAVAWMFDTYGRVSMEHTHQLLMLSLAIPECQAVHLSFDHMGAHFDQDMERWLVDGWHIPRATAQELLKVLQRHDLSRRTAAQRAQEHHISGGWMSKEQKAAVKRAIRSNPAIRALLEAQRRELGIHGGAAAAAAD